MNSSLFFQMDDVIALLSKTFSEPPPNAKKLIMDIEALNEPEALAILIMARQMHYCRFTVVGYPEPSAMPVIQFAFHLKTLSARVSGETAVRVMKMREKAQKEEYADF